MSAGPVSKAPGALKSIGEVSTETGVAAHILRYWEDHVPALNPVRRAGGRRYYRAEDVALIRQLQSLMAESGYTLEGAARAVNTAEVFETAAATVTAELNIAAIRSVRDRLARALAAS
jgi:DNA-binding transcriptional MerR regulator